MSEETPIRDLFDQLHDEGIVPEDQKPLPYLGWWLKEPWLDSTRISYYRGKFWIDTKKKWPYPKSQIDTELLVEKCRELLEESLEDGRPPNRRKFQEFLSENTGTFTKEIRTGDEWERVEVDVRD
jgi:hypothetical protein